MAKRKIETFEDLEVWKDAMEVAVKVYHLVNNKERLKKEFAIRNQIINSACSIANNIAEGFEYDNKGDLIRFLKYSKGSSGECRNQLIFLRRIGFIEDSDFNLLHPHLLSVSKQLKGFIKYLNEYKPSKK